MIINKAGHKVVTESYPSWIRSSKPWPAALPSLFKRFPAAVLTLENYLGFPGRSGFFGGAGASLQAESYHVPTKILYLRPNIC